MAAIADTRTGLQRAEGIAAIFKVLWPWVCAVVGVILLLAIVVVPSLRDPTLIGTLTGFYAIIGTAGAALHARKGGSE